NFCVIIGDSSAGTVHTVSGAIAITGTGSPTGTGTGNTGVSLANGLVETSGAGSITITGNRGGGVGSDLGIQVDAAAVVRSTTTGTGAIQLIAGAGGATTGGSNHGIYVANGGV